MRRGLCSNILRDTLSELNEGGTGTPHWEAILICTVYHPCVAAGERLLSNMRKMNVINTF